MWVTERRYALQDLRRAEVLIVDSRWTTINDRIEEMLCDMKCVGSVRLQGRNRHKVLRLQSHAIRQLRRDSFGFLHRMERWRRYRRSFRARLLCAGSAGGKSQLMYNVGKEFGREAEAISAIWGLRQE